MAYGGGGAPTPPMPGPPPPGQHGGGAFYPGEYASLESREAPKGTLWSPGATQQTGPKQEIPPWMMPQVSGWGGASYQHAHEAYIQELPQGVEWAQEKVSGICASLWPFLASFSEARRLWFPRFKNRIPLR